MALELVDVDYRDLKNRHVDFPIGNTGNTVTARYTLENAFRVELTNSMQIEKIGNKFVLSGTLPNGQQATWANAGIIADAPIYYSLYFGTYNGVTDASHDITSESGVVQFINGNELFVVTDPEPTFNNVTYSIGNFQQLDTPHGIEMAFNIASNDSPGMFSLIDGEPRIFVIDNLNFLGVGNLTNFVQLGNKSGTSYMEANITLVQDGLSTKSKFIIDVKFRYPHYLLPDLFAQGASVAPWVRFRASQQFNNWNNATSVTYAPQGNIGYFDKHFSGGTPAYTFTSIAWTNNANQVLASMDLAAQSNFKIIIAGAFDTACQFNIGWFWSPANEDDYKNKPLSHDETLMLVTKAATNSTIFGPETIVGYENADGAQLTISNLSYTVINGGTALQVTGKTTPNPEFETFFNDREGDRAYSMWVDCDGSAFNSDWDSSTAVNVQVPVAQMIKTEVPLGIWDDISYFQFLDHNGDEFLSPTVYTEDDLNVQVKFKIPRNSVWEYVSGSIIAFNSSSGESFTLESQSFNIEPSTQLPFLPDGTQPINETISRNFNLPNGYGKNEISLKRNPSQDSVSHYGLTLNYGFLCRWEYWLQQLNVNAAFFSTQNKNWQQFQGNGWALKFQFSLTKAAGSYQNAAPFSIKTYDDYIGTSITEFFKLDGTQINAPLINEPVRIKTTHTIDSPYDWDSPEWANMTVEPFEGGPRWLLSSLTYTLDPNNPLYPLSGETGVKITLSNDEAITECLYDPLKMNGVSRVSFTSRIQANEIPEIGDMFIFQSGEGVLSQDDDNLIPQ